MNQPLVALLGVERATVPNLVAARVQATPDSTFLLWDDQRWTYAEAFHQIRRFAGWLTARWITNGGPPDVRRVASFIGNRPETIWAWLGALHAGAVYVPINYGHRGAILEDMLVRSHADVLVTDRTGVDHLAASGLEQIASIIVVDDRRAENSERLTLVPWADVQSAAPADPEPVPIDPADPAMVVYTSGTTGRSKAVLMSHNQLCRGASATSHALEITKHDVTHAWLPLFHVAGQVDSLLCTLIPGGTVALVDRFSLSRFWDEVQRYEATIFTGFTNVLELLWKRPESPFDHENPLRVGMIGGVPPVIRNPFEQRFGLHLCDVYGLTEAEPLALPEPGVTVPLGACGRANPDFEIAIQRRDGRPAPAGEVGEIVARPLVADVMFLAYEDDESATLATIKDLWFHTGDLGRLDADGFLYFVDRKRHAIRRRGENVSSWELETIVLQHPAVAECCAVGVPSPLGEDDIKVAVVPADGCMLDPGALIEWCRTRMARFMLPRYVLVTPRLPRGETGKVLKDQIMSQTHGQWDSDAVTRE